MGLAIGSGCSPDSCQIIGIFLQPECPEGSGSQMGGLQSLMTMTPLFTDVAGNIPFLEKNIDFDAGVLLPSP